MFLAETLKQILAGDAQNDRDEFLQHCLNVGDVGPEEEVVRLGPGVMGMPGGGSAYSRKRPGCEEQLNAIRQLHFDPPSKVPPSTWEK